MLAKAWKARGLDKTTSFPWLRPGAKFTYLRTCDLSNFDIPLVVWVLCNDRKGNWFAGCLTQPIPSFGRSHRWISRTVSANPTPRTVRTARNIWQAHWHVNCVDKYFHLRYLSIIPIESYEHPEGFPVPNFISRKSNRIQQISLAGLIFKRHCSDSKSFLG